MNVCYIIHPETVFSYDNHRTLPVDLGSPSDGRSPCRILFPDGWIRAYGERSRGWWSDPIPQKDINAYLRRKTRNIRSKATLLVDVQPLSGPDKSGTYRLALYLIRDHIPLTHCVESRGKKDNMWPYLKPQYFPVRI